MRNLGAPSNVALRSCWAVHSRGMIGRCVVDDLSRDVLHDNEREDLTEADIVRLQEIAGPYLMPVIWLQS